MYIDDRFINNFLEKYKELDARSDRINEKMDRAEAIGDTAKYNRLDRQEDRLISKMDGMTDVLWMLGYEIQYQNGNPVIVQR